MARFHGFLREENVCVVDSVLTVTLQRGRRPQCFSVTACLRYIDSREALDVCHRQVVGLNFKGVYFVS